VQRPELQPLPQETIFKYCFRLVVASLCRLRTFNHRNRQFLWYMFLMGGGYRQRLFIFESVCVPPN